MRTIVNQSRMIFNRRFLLIFLLFVSALQVSADLSLNYFVFSKELSYANLFSFYMDILFHQVWIVPISIILTFLMIKKISFEKQQNYSLYKLIMSTVFMFFFVVGRHYFLSILLPVTLLDYCILVLSGCLYYFFINISIGIFDRLVEVFKVSSSKSFSSKITFVFSFISMLIISIPLIYFFYPGPVHWDGLAQLNQFFRIRIWDNHYPAISTVIFGYLMNIGRHIADDNFGIFLYTILQVLFSITAFSYVITFINDRYRSRVLTIFAYLFFTIYPIWLINAYTYVKDTPYYLSVLLLTVQLIKYYDKGFRKGFWVYCGIIIAFLGIWIFRNDGYYVILLTLISMILFNFKSKPILEICILIMFVSLNSVYHYRLPKYEIYEGSPREMLSVPIQQAARLCKFKSEDLSNSERKVFESFFVRSCFEIGEMYNPETSDNVKIYFAYNPTAKQFEDFFSFWKVNLIRYPSIYVESFLENYYGYFYPVKREYKDGIAWFSIQYSDMVYTGDFNLYMKDHLNFGRKIIIDTIDKVRTMPIIELIFNVGTYNWILLYALYYMLKGKYYARFFTFIPLLITLLICVVSPVNAYVRYVLPIMVSIPLVLTSLLSLEKDS